VTWDVLLGYATGLRLVAPDMDPVTLIRTLIVIHLCNAVMCRLLAHNNGYSKPFWTVAGFVFGIWAVATLILLPRRTPPRD
jgi:hypothetical protein